MTDNGIHEISHAIGQLAGEIKGMATEIRTLAQNTHEVHEKMIALDASVVKAHWRHDDTGNKIVDLKKEIVRIAETVQTHEDLKKKAIWATLGLSAGGAFAGNKFANFIAALFTP
jgi:uncharacterized coiled-coil DUF342 family protein